MKIFNFLLLFSLFSLSSALADNFIVEQGSVNISLDDIDNFALTIPKDKRAGYFESIKRIDTTLKTILTMKHIVNYAVNNNLIDSSVVSIKVDALLKNNFNQENLGDNLVEQDINRVKLSKYLVLKNSYVAMQDYIVNSVKSIDVIELAKEEYMINKKDYFHVERRDLSYFNVIFDEKNKSEKREKAFLLIKDLKNNKFDFNAFNDKYENTDSDIEIIPKLEKYKKNKMYAEFSDYVFKNNKLGLIEDVLDSNSRFSVVVINKIYPEGYYSFDEIKDSLITKLKKAKVERKFGDLVSKLTQDSITVNEEAIASIKNRYIEKDI